MMMNAQQAGGGNGKMMNFGKSRAKMTLGDKDVYKRQELKKDGKVQLVGFGTFAVSRRAAREGRNPQSGAPRKIAASKAPKFKAGKALKDMLNA